MLPCPAKRTARQRLWLPSLHPGAYVVRDSRVHRHAAPVEGSADHDATHLVAEDKGAANSGVANSALPKPVQI